MRLDPPLFASLNRLHTEFIRARTSRSRAVGAAARALGVLPITDDWERDFGIRIEDGEVISFNRDVPHDPRVECGGWIRLAILHHARFKYPELAGMLPPRPPDAEDCGACLGEGVRTRPDGERYSCPRCVCGWRVDDWDAYSTGAG